MVIDTSAILAILNNEPETHHFNELIVSSLVRLISAATYLETAIVVEARFGPQGVHNMKLFFSVAGLRIVPFDADQTKIAAKAYSKYGKGRHIAGLNFGDCFAYALSQFKREPLLFKGDDFVHTDVKSCVHA